jgi:phosphatidylglycerol:prolipoprotein diacylglycerol transferase
LPYVDARYLGLTPAQFASLAAIAWGLYSLVRRRAEPATTQESTG